MAIIALGTMMSYSVIGYVDYTLFNIREGTVSQYGNIQIASPLLWNEEYDEFNYLLSPDEVAKIYKVLDETPHVVAKTQQLNIFGIANIGNNTKILRISALEPDNDALDYNNLVIEGVGLEPDDRGTALVGESFAKQLNLKPGDSFTVNASTVSGQYNLQPIKIAGIYSLNNAQAESQIIFVPLKYGQNLLNTNSVGKIIVKTDSIDIGDEVSEQIQASLSSDNLTSETRTWVELSDFYRQIVGFFNILFGFITFVVFVLVFFMILQVLTLSFLERTKEIGTIRAIGTKRSQVFGMFVMESILLGFMGSLLGIGLGQLFGIGFNNLGLGWTPPGAIEDVPVRLSLTVANAWTPFAATTLATVVSSLYPSNHSSKIHIVDALRKGQ
jgi:putative ABC transport system permease protein